ncbi:Lipoma HMGIC fusion partner-like protein [Popillia japonica]|uniref:Lipoma HMGIC fusion partner-like protein n=1 Tax=Popillia japonica TaxID=7064 RepID=A0AAW1NMT5_POPJA
MIPAALLVIGGAAIYPIGWDNREVRESCGNQSHIYKLGTCHLYWSVYLLSSAVLLLLTCFGLSFCASRQVIREQRRHAVQQQVIRELANVSAPPATRSRSKEEVLSLPSIAINLKQTTKEEVLSLPSIAINLKQTTHMQKIKRFENTRFVDETRIVTNNYTNHIVSQAKTLPVKRVYMRSKSWGPIQRSNSSRFCESNRKGMINSLTLDISRLPTMSLNNEFTSAGNIPKCLIENNIEKFN